MKNPASFHTVITISAPSTVSRWPSQLVGPNPSTRVKTSTSP